MIDRLHTTGQTPPRLAKPLHVTAANLLLASGTANIIIAHSERLEMKSRFNYHLAMDCSLQCLNLSL
jgi:hypothetical protein